MIGGLSFSGILNVKMIGWTMTNTTIPLLQLEQVLF